MATDHAERRLVAVLAADVVGYSRLIEADEAGTLAAMKTLRTAVTDPLLDEYHGRIVKLMGDGAIIEFGSVVDAVACAVEAQKRVAAAQVGTPPERFIRFRMGINLGDVVVDGDDLLGDGVNVAARLEQLCEPGGVFVSGTAYDQLQGKLGLPLEFIGEQHVKNISRPVRTYRVQFEGATRRRPTHTRQLRYATAALVLLAAGAGAWWFQPWTGDVRTATADRHVLALPDKPSLAVLPFDNLSADPEQAYFADGMTEDLITDLSKLSGIFVTSRNSTFAYKGKSTNLRQIAEELGVQYVLEGSVRRQDDQVRINVQLIDARGDHHIWADRYDAAMGEIFSVQDKVLRQIVSALTVEITSAERSVSERVETVNSEAYDRLLKGLGHLRSESEKETLVAIPLLEEAVRLDPNYARAYAALALANWRIASSGWESANLHFQKSMEKVYQNLTLAMRKPNALAHAVSAEVLAKQGHYQEALAAISSALNLAPQDADIYVSKARILNATGKAEEGEKTARDAMRLDPQYPPGFLRVLALSLFNQQKYEEALEAYSSVVEKQQDIPDDYATIVSILGHLGRKEGVKENIGRYDAITVPVGYSPLTVQEMGWWWYGDAFNYHRPYVEQMQEGLRKAGVPSGAGTDLAFDEYARLVNKTNGEYNVTGARKIDAQTTKRLHDSGIKLFDVRSEVSFARAHASGAINISVTTALTKDALAKATLRKDEGIIFSCHGKYCSDSAYASAKALAWGYTTVYHFAGGFPAWEDARYPIESDTANQ
ncbi:tetratricopeptide repeat protein (plasmid) [Rhizobium sp. TH2]|uniref:rhodanese-like domain-containing protein n=1 Tax=Rhizobium sp. TH2 TaxID=2775403 RepID=UPI0021587B20|nr:rhodanese-like domain-containing protein [Rhizobium sp. TH2]UVC12250.1 tetratricopeptide repeat protein [Rhizobium sp. TH2]